MNIDRYLYNYIKQYIYDNYYNNNPIIPKLNNYELVDGQTTETITIYIHYNESANYDLDMIASMIVISALSNHITDNNDLLELTKIATDNGIIKIAPRYEY